MAFDVTAVNTYFDREEGEESGPYIDVTNLKNAFIEALSQAQDEIDALVVRIAALELEVDYLGGTGA